MEIKDLCSLEEENEEFILKTLKDRYEAGKIYTSIGDILLSINPYKSLDIHSSEYSHHSKKLLSPPHIFALSKQLYQSLVVSSESQCFIVSGESGAGKTETAKFVLDHFLSQCVPEDRKLIDKIKKTGIILDSFGNAKTSLNDNSTRHGKFLQVYFSTTGKLSLAYITEYLLEKSRVTQQNKEEQNYHVFFYLFSGRNEEELSKHLLDLPTQHRYLKYGEAFGDEVLAWSQSYKSLINALEIFAFSKEEISGIFGLLSAVLNLGDLKFNLEDEKTGVYIENLEILDKVAILLGVESDDLELCLTSNTMLHKDDSLSSFKNLSEATSCRDNLSKTLYSRLFAWIISRMNSLMDVHDVKKKRSELLSVGFLDMFGFENLQRNSIEQLCINVANEQLQLHFSQHVFALEQVEYEEEGLDITHIDYMENKALINLLLEKPHGIFALLEDESKCLQADDNTLVSSFNAQCSEHKNYIASSSKPIFSIVHFTTKVAYLADGFLEKNNDRTDQSLIECLKNSHDALVSTLFSSVISRIGSLTLKTGAGKKYCCHGDLRPIYEKRRKHRNDHDRGYNTNKASHNTKSKGKKTLTSKKQKPPLTLGSQFRNSLVDLMEKILLCQAHFVRCIKPNKMKEADKFDDDLVMTQIKYLCVMDTIKIRKHGYPARFLFKTFLERYRFLSFDFLSPIEYTAENCKLILGKIDIVDGFKIGKTKIFLQLLQIEKLSEELENLTRKVITTQRRNIYR